MDKPRPAIQQCWAPPSWSHFVSNTSHDLTYDCCQTRQHPLLHIQTLSNAIQMFAIMRFWGIATNWRGVSDEEKQRCEKWEREWIIWTSTASPQELMYSICLLALIYAPSLQRWSISRSTTWHVCMGHRSKPYASAPFPWKPNKNVWTCYVTSQGVSTHWTTGHWEEPLQQLNLLNSDLKFLKVIFLEDFLRNITERGVLKLHLFLWQKSEKSVRGVVGFFRLSETMLKLDNQGLVLKV